MAVGQAFLAAVAVTVPGLLAFIFGVVAENKKPDDPSEAPGLIYDPVTDTSTCHYPKDHTVAYGIVSIVFLFITALLALVALYFPYNGKRVSLPSLWRNTCLVVFTILSLIITLMAEALLLWAVILQSHHRMENNHSGQIAQCPSAKSGLLGGAGFLALDATLFFLISLMLTTNARSDYFREDLDDVDDKGFYGAVENAPPVTEHGPATIAPPNIVRISDEV